MNASPRPRSERPAESPSGLTTRDGPSWGLRAILATTGLVLLLGGTWSLLQPSRLAERVALLFADPELRQITALVLWVALVMLATYGTAAWDRLGRAEFVLGWVGIAALWLAGMLLLYLPAAGYQLLIEPLLANPPVVRAGSLAAIVVGATLDVLALAGWARPEPKDHGHTLPPRAIRPTHHARPA